MAVTITRSVWIDDDGTGQTGTVINQALHTTLYNEIDTALAKVAQLTGGNTFTGNQTITGLLNVTGFGAHNIVSSGTGQLLLQIQNTSAGAGNSTSVLIGNDASPSLTALVSYASNYSGSGLTSPNGTLLQANGAGGLSVAASTGVIRFYSAGAERLRFTPTGELLVNSSTNPGNGQLAVTSDGSVRNGLAIQNTSAANGMYFATFFNSAGSLSGSILQTAAGSVAYQTTSDARLKTDHGRATDLAALRGLTVHDFTWTADGVPDRGIFAQEAHALYPRAVVAGTDDTTESGALARPWMTDYSKFVPDLIVGWQQHDAEIAPLWQAIHDLRRELRELATLKG